MLTSVITHATGDVFPASDWNTYIRDNINYMGFAGADLASAATVTPTNRTHLITGTTTIDNISATGAVKGGDVRLVFQATTTVRHNGGGTGNIRLCGNIHAGFVANETLTLVYDGTNWVEAARSPKHLSGQEVAMSHAGLAGGGYLIEDGSAVSRTGLAALFANQGTVFGVGDGSTTFNLPDSRGRMTVGYAPSGGHTDVATIGLNDGIAVAFRRPKHRTTLSDPGHVHTLATYAPGALTNGVNSIDLDATSPVTRGSLVNSATTGIGVGTGNANDPLDAPAYIVKPKYIRI